jgi:dCTP diphosphatase
MSQLHNINNTNIQSSNTEESSDTTFSPCQLEEFRCEISKFASDRDWLQYHTPRNLLLALVGEIGELSEIFQWKGEVNKKQIQEEWTEKERTALSEELSDCFIYLIRLSDRCGIDLAAAAKRKLQLNGHKYPAELVRGSAKKYNEYREDYRNKMK